MGGDHAPSAIADGAVAAAAAFQLDIQISLGAPGAIEQALARHGQPRPAAITGGVYATVALGVERPRIGLLCC